MNNIFKEHLGVGEMPTVLGCFFFFLGSEARKTKKNRSTICGKDSPKNSLRSLLAIFANPLTPTRVKIPKIGKEGFRVKKLPFLIAPEKGALSKNNPHFSTAYHKENEDFGLKAPLSAEVSLELGSYILRDTPKP